MRSLRQAFADIPIVRKLYAGFSAALVLLLIYAANAIHDFDELGKEFRAFADMAHDTRLVAEIEADLINLQLQAREYLTTREDEDARHAFEVYAKLARDLADAKNHIQKPERVALLLEIIELKERYRLGFERVVELNKRRDALVDDTLNPIGQRIREALTTINEKAYRDKDHVSANYAGVVQEDLLTARLYVNRFLGTNNLADVRRVYEEFNEVDAALVPLDQSLTDPERLRLLDAVKAGLPLYRRTFAELVAVISERNDIRVEIFDKIDASIIEKAEAIEVSADADMKLLDQKATDLVRDQIAEGVIAAILAMAAAFAIAWFIGHGIGDPIREMTGAMNRLASGDTSVAIPGEVRKDEVSAMSQAVRVFKENLIEAGRLREAEKRALQLAEKASQAKSEFLSAMSHELRTPLNAILGFAQILEMDSSLSPKHKESVQIIHKAGAHLLTLINEVLDLARVEAGRLELSIEDVPLAEMFDECETLIGPVAREKGIAVAFPPLQDLPFVRADRTRLKQAIVKLLGNAVKYNRAQGSVRISAAESEGGKVRIAIEDTGIGIPAELLGELFTPFSRFSVESSEVEGTGIGLAITKRLVEAMGGIIGVESVVNVGSTFWIVLPAATEARAAAAPAAAAAPTATDSKMRTATVLYVEDNPLNMLLVRQVLGVFPEIELIEAQSAQFGLDLAEARQPDLILLDINLPGMSGIEVVARLRSEPKTRTTPVIAISAAAMPEDIARAMNAGFDDYITKPINISTLLEKVSGYLQRQAPETQAASRG